MIRFVKERIQVVRVDMLYKAIPKRLTIEMVHRVVVLMNSLPRKGSLHSILSPRKILTSNMFRCPTICIGQYKQGLVGAANDTEQGRSINALYLGRMDNGSGYSVFK